MISYLLKSALCLLILLLVHRLILQREAIYQFNRFYLLFAVIGSFLIPLIELEVVDEAPIIVAEEVNQEVEFSPDLELTVHPFVVSDFVSEAELTEKPFDWNLLFWSVYGLVTLVFLIRFVRNIKLLLDKINRNIHVQFRGETLVLLSEKSLPYSFLSYIFVAKDYFEEGQLTDSIFAHEQAHVHGRHSWDNLLIESLLVVFWFHPGLYLARQAIKLNHEFIADEAALQITPVDQYKSFLLAMMLPDQHPGLVSSLNFSLTKKRFEMMKRKTANSTKWIMILCVIPVLGALVYVFSEKVTAQGGEESKDRLAVDIDNEIKETEIQILIRTEGKLEVDGQIIELSQLAELIESKNKENTLARISADPEVEMGFLADVQEVLRENEIRKVVYNQHTEGSDPSPSSQKDTYYRNATFFVEDEKGEFNRKDYEELSSDEKSYLVAPAKAPAMKFPTLEVLQKWRNSKEFAVWLDGVAISNDKLASLSPSDIVFYFSSFFPTGQRTTTHPQAYKIRLFTADGYRNTFGAESGFASPLVEDDIFYIYPLTKRVNYGRTIVKSKQSPIDMYLQLYESYSSRFDGKRDDDLSEWEQAIGWQYFTELGGRFFRLSASNKKLVPRANRPEFQYWVPLVKDGVRYYKKQNDLTEEEKKQLPPPPPAPKQEDHEDVSYTFVYGLPFQSLTKAEYYSETKFRVKNPNGEIEEFSYEELPENYKKNLPNPPGAVSKNVPSPELFESWKNGEEFAIWIDGKVVPNSKLEEMKTSDIAYFFSSFVHSNARSERFPQNYQVNIYTLSGFENTYGRNSNFGKKPMGGTITIGSVTPKSKPISDNSSKKPVDENIPNSSQYQKLATEFQLKISNNGMFTSPSDEEIALLQTQFQELEKTYFNLSIEERRKVTRAGFPYAKIEKDGQIRYKKFEFLTAEERNALGC